MENSVVQEKILWIDCVKFIAIFAVIMDHTRNILYTNAVIQTVSFFSVTVFVFLSGVTSYYSVKRHKDRNLVHEIGRRLGIIVWPYMVATLIYQLAHDHAFDIKIFLLHLVRFDASAPFYFVAFFIQLIIIAPGLVYLLDKCQKSKRKLIGYMMLLLLMIGIALLSIRYTGFGEIYGGGHYLFGGSYLVVFFLGMLFAHLGMPIYRKWGYEIALFAISIVLMSGMMIGLILRGMWLDYHQFFGIGLNPPGITLFSYSMTVIAVLMLIFSWMERSRVKGFSFFARVIGKLGSYSLYIFLYHLLFMEVMEAVTRKINFNIQWVKCVVYLPAMILGPIVFVELYRYVKIKIARKEL